jgi:hypothetical protein
MEVAALQQDAAKQDAVAVDLVEVRALFAEPGARHNLEAIRQGEHRHVGPVLDQPLNTVVFAVHFDRHCVEVGQAFEKITRTVSLTVADLATVFRLKTNGMGHGPTRMARRRIECFRPQLPRGNL